MAKFYFTYGDNPAFPYQDGWTEVIAEDRKWAVMAYEKFHHKRPGSTYVNCALVYSEWEWFKTYMAAAGENFGHGCHDRITMEIQPVSNTWTPDTYAHVECEEKITYRREDLDG